MLWSVNHPALFPSSELSIIQLFPCSELSIIQPFLCSDLSIIQPFPMLWSVNHPALFPSSELSTIQPFPVLWAVNHSALSPCSELSIIHPFLGNKNPVQTSGTQEVFSLKPWSLRDIFNFKIDHYDHLYFNAKNILSWFSSFRKGRSTFPCKYLLLYHCAVNNVLWLEKVTESCQPL